MLFIGIDVGLTGGIAAVDKEGQVQSVHAFKPLDGDFDAGFLSAILTEIIATSPVTVGVEKVQSMPKQGVASTFKFGKTYGQILGILAGKLIPYHLITPQAWTKMMLVGEKKDDGKKRSKLVAQRLYPSVNLKATSRSTAIHSGMADAILIAEFVRRTHSP